MTPPLFLVDQLPAADEVVLDGDEGRHAARVKRLRPGEPALVGDGRGTVVGCRVDTVETVGADRVALTVLSRRVEPEPDPRLVVIQALPKGERGELAVELMTELGVDEIVPWAAARSVVQWRGERAARAVDRWRRTAREAAKQSRRARVPIVGNLASTADAATRLCSAAVSFVLHESATAPLSGAQLARRGEIVLVVGPEGGIGDDELAQFDAATPVRLGGAVLRSSSAGGAAVAVLSVRLGRWS